MLAMSTFSEKSWNSSEDYDDDNSSTSSTVNRRINNGEMIEVNGNNVITTHCVSTVIKPGDKQLHDPLQFVKIKSTELSQKAKEQIKLAEEVKITKEKIKEVEEEWQNNLLSWKSKRRQSKRSSEEELEDNNSINNSRKIKTFNEILNEKAKSGHRIGYNLHQYLNEEDNDLINDQSSIKSFNTDNSANLNISNEKEQINNFNNKFTDHASNNSLSYSQTDSKYFSNDIQLEHENDQIDDSIGVVINTNLLKEYSSNNLSHSKENKINDQSNNLSYEDENQLPNQILNTINNKNENKNILNENNLNFNDESKNKTFTKINEAFSLNKSSTSDSIKKNENSVSAYNKTKEIKKVDTNSLNESNKNVDNQNLKLSFKAKLSAFESLAKNEIKKPDITKNPPIKNKLRMSSSNNLISDCKNIVDENKNLMPKNNDGFSKRFTSKSNENLSKTFKNAQELSDKNDENLKMNFNNKNSSRSEYKLTKSESNLMKNKTHFNDRPIEITQSDQNLPINNFNLINKSFNNTSNKINQAINNVSFSSENKFDYDNDISELSHLMQQQVIHNDQSNINQSLSPINQEIQQSSQYIKSINDITNSSNTINYFNDDYANSTVSNQSNDIHQTPLNNLMNNAQQTQNFYNQQVSNEIILRDATNQFINSNIQSHSMFNPAITKQSMSTSMLTQPGYYEDNFSSNIYGNYYSNNSIPNNYQFQKDNRSTSSSQLEYASNGLPVTNQAYYQEKNSVPLKTNLGVTNNLSQLPYSNMPVNRHSQPQLNIVNSKNQQSISSNLPTNQQQTAYNYNHWLIQEAELRRQIATRNGNSLISNTVNTAKNQNLINSKTNNCHLGLINNGISSENIYKDDQPVYENTIIYNSHKKQQQLQHNFSNNLASQYLGQQQVSKPPYPNPSPVSNNQNSLNQTDDQKSSLNVDNDINSINETSSQQYYNQQQKQQKQLLSVSGKKKCSNCGDELGRGCAAMVIETLSLYYHINCFRCSVCHIILGNGTSGTDVRVRNYKLNCQNCYSNDEGIFY